jgi:DNA-binding NarL/FixJ family response regulator
MRVVIADDTPLLRHGLARLLSEAGVEICGEAADATALLELVQREQPDVAIVDIRMPPTHTDEGLVAATTIRSRFPATGVLVLSHYIEASYALRLLDADAGPAGYLLKDRVMNTGELIDALHRVAAGGIVVDRELVDSLVTRRREPDPLDELTEREHEVLGLMAEGLTDRGIADRLWLTPNTVETHVRHILRKLDLPIDVANNRRVRAVLTYLRA